MAALFFVFLQKQNIHSYYFALCVFALFIIVNAIINPASIFGGIIFKIDVCVTLIKGLQHAKEAQQIKVQLVK